jgi:Fur family transcriptional regulator, iron response regulator
MQIASSKNSRIWLKKSQLRPTRQRLALADLLVGDGQDRHVTAESLFSAVNDKGETISLATVYNTLNTFRDAGLLTEVVVNPHKSYFCTRVDDHPHFYWEEKGLLTDAPNDKLQLSGIPEAPEGAEIEKVDVVIRLREK